MAINIDAVLGVDEESPEFLVVGYCDVLVQGLTSGTVTLQYRLTPTTALPSPTWVAFPDGAFSEDVYKTVFLSEHGIRCKLVGASNNTGVYVRIARYLND